MARLVAFLRAVNVGGRTIKMDQLRRVFERGGFENVETFIASGNVIFDAPTGSAAALESRIEQQLEKAFGYQVGVYLRSGEEVAAVAAHEPFDVPDDASLFVVFLRDAPDRAMWSKVTGLRSEYDDFAARKREVYWMTRRGFSGSTVAPAFGKICVNGTMRNVTTVRKLAAKYGFR